MFAIIVWAFHWRAPVTSATAAPSKLSTTARNKPLHLAAVTSSLPGRLAPQCQAEVAESAVVTCCVVEPCISMLERVAARSQGAPSCLLRMTGRWTTGLSAVTRELHLGCPLLSYCLSSCWQSPKSKRVNRLWVHVAKVQARIQGLTFRGAIKGYIHHLVWSMQCARS